MSFMSTYFKIGNRLCRLILPFTSDDICMVDYIEPNYAPHNRQIIDGKILSEGGYGSDLLPEVVEYVNRLLKLKLFV